MKEAASLSAGKFRISYPARAQVELLSKSDKRALAELFSRPDLRRAEVTKQTDSGNYVSRLGSRRVLWRMADRTPMILSVVDRSYAGR
jgi:hypothetical protein